MILNTRWLKEGRLSPERGEQPEGAKVRNNSATTPFLKMLPPNGRGSPFPAHRWLKPNSGSSWRSCKSHEYTLLYRRQVNYIAVWEIGTMLSPAIWSWQQQCNKRVKLSHWEIPFYHVGHQHLNFPCGQRSNAKSWNENTNSNLSDLVSSANRSLKRKVKYRLQQFGHRKEKAVRVECTKISCDACFLKALGRIQNDHMGRRNLIAINRRKCGIMAMSLYH